MSRERTLELSDICKAFDVLTRAGFLVWTQDANDGVLAPHVITGDGAWDDDIAREYVSNLRIRDLRGTITLPPLVKP